MNVVLRVLDQEYEIGVEVGDGATTVGGLVAALVGTDDSSAAVNGVKVSPEVPIAEVDICEGAVIDVAVGAEPRVVGTLFDVTAGGRVAVRVLRSGVVSIGRPPADVEVVGVAGRVSLHVDQLGRCWVRSPDGSSAKIDGERIEPGGTELLPGSVLSVGGSRFATSDAGPETMCGSASFNRPPRPISLYRPMELEAPGPVQPAREAMRFGWGALIVPVILGLGMAALIHPRMAVFALFSPAMLLANWLEDRRRVKRERRDCGDAYVAELERFRGDVATAHRMEAEHRWQLVVRPHALEARAMAIDSRLWERRPFHDDFLTVPVGTGCLPWEPRLAVPAAREAAQVLGSFDELHDIPVEVSLDAGEVVGVAGQRAQVLGVAFHLLLQAAIHHGPADLAISIFTENPEQWDWAKWLPHVVVDSSGRRRLAGNPEEIADVVSLLPDDDDLGRHHLVVIDVPDLAAGPRASIREVVQAGKARGVAAIALAGRALDLPSLATSIVALEPQDRRIRFPDGRGTALHPWTVGAATARRAARALARIDDPEAATSGAGLPASLHLASLLGLGSNPSLSIATNWRGPADLVPVPIGVTSEGPLLVDIVTDGPHALMGGTTGAGKSELLRTLVASLAASMSPADLNFVLVDYKGGSAFDACAALPHTVGLVTDLDEHLARRALTCLEAELRYREERLRIAEVSTIESFPRGTGEPLPRLLVVIDEFAALAKELPDFMDALVGVAQRGRSLGVHLVLATQRPSGVISDSIKANTNLRIALRVQDTADSVDVIGSQDAASIGRSQPGRGLARRGPGDVVAFQTALVTGCSQSNDGARVSARPFRFAYEQAEEHDPSPLNPSGPTDLEAIVAASCVVADEMALVPSRLPWPDALPVATHLDELPRNRHDPGAAPYGIADEPHRQRQVAAAWSAAAGNLLLYGLPGSGTSTALATLAVSVANTADPDRIHLYILDFDDQLLHPLAGLPHVGAVVAGNDRERQLRLLRRLTAELQDRRQAMSHDSADIDDYPVIVTMLDNYGAFADAYGEPGDMAVHNLLSRLVADGPGVGMMTIITAKYPGDIPTRVASLVAPRLVFRLADRYDYSGLGVPPVEPPSIAGRAFESGTGREIQIALAHPDGLAAAVAANASRKPDQGPWSIDVLPREVGIAEFISASRISSQEWFLPLGIGDSSLVPVGLVLREGDHALITGPPRSGKTTALATIASVAKAAGGDVRVAAVLPRRSPLSNCSAVDEFIEADEVDRLSATGDSWLLLIDDAVLVDKDVELRALLNDRDPRVRVVAAGTADEMRGMYGHWTQDLRRSRIGCALRPNTASDGDLWQTQLPRHPQQLFPAGRGYLLADGQTELVQLGRA